MAAAGTGNESRRSTTVGKDVLRRLMDGLLRGGHCAAQSTPVDGESPRNAITMANFAL